MVAAPAPKLSHGHRRAGAAATLARAATTRFGRHRGLTLRSTGAPTAGHQARLRDLSIIPPPGLASHRRLPVTSNVMRRHSLAQEGECSARGFRCLRAPPSNRGPRRSGSSGHCPHSATSADARPARCIRTKVPALNQPPPFLFARWLSFVSVVALARRAFVVGATHNQPLEARHNGVAPGPRGFQVYLPPRGPGATPLCPASALRYASAFARSRRRVLRAWLPLTSSSAIKPRSAEERPVQSLSPQRHLRRRVARSLYSNQSARAQPAAALSVRALAQLRSHLGAHQPCLLRWGYA